MTHAEMVAALHAIERAQEDRIHVWRIVIDEKGQETGQRIYRGSFQQPRDSRNGEKSPGG